MFRAAPVRVRVPATSANLGPGFDALGLALALHDDVVVRVSDEPGLTVDVAGMGAASVARNSRNLVVKAMRATFDILGGKPRGLDVVCADVSPVGLAVARERAAAAGVALRTMAVDLETEPLPPGPFELIVAIDFLHRLLLTAVPDALAAGGLFVMAQPTRTNLTRNAHPSARFLLDDGELPRLVVGLEVVRYDEGWFGDRHEACLVARKAR